MNDLDTHPSVTVNLSLPSVKLLIFIQHLQKWNWVSLEPARKGHTSLDFRTITFLKFVYKAISYEFEMWKHLKGSHDLRIFSMCWTWPLTPASRSNGVIILKRPYIYLIIAPRASEYKNSPWEVLACKCFACVKFCPHLPSALVWHWWGSA